MIVQKTQTSVSALYPDNLKGGTGATRSRLPGVYELFFFFLCHDLGLNHGLPSVTCTSANLGIGEGGRADIRCDKLNYFSSQFLYFTCSTSSMIPFLLFAKSFSVPLILPILLYPVDYTVLIQMLIPPHLTSTADTFFLDSWHLPQLLD